MAAMNGDAQPFCQLLPDSSVLNQGTDEELVSILTPLLALLLVVIGFINRFHGSKCFCSDFSASVMMSTYDALQNALAKRFLCAGRNCDVNPFDFSCKNTHINGFK